MSDVENSQDESSSSEEEEPFLDETNDKFFFKTLSCLKNKDPKIYDPNVVFFPKDGTEGSGDREKRASKKGDAVFLRDYEREQVVRAMNGEAVEEGDDSELPYVAQQKSLKASFKAALEDEDEDDGLLTVKSKSSVDQEKEEEEYKMWLKGNKGEMSDKQTERDLKPLHDFWSKPDLEPNEQFLRDYILNKKYLEEGEEAEDDGISEDGELLELQEKFETDYNMRFETDTNTEVKRYPRVIEGSVRRKDESRKRKRKERSERKRLEKGKKKEEIAQNQKQKLLEFKEQVDKIKKLTGNDQLGFRDDELFGEEDFNPEEHDRKMQELYGDAFYSAEGDEEKPDFTEEADVGGWDEEEGGPDNMDLEAGPSNKETRTKRKKKDKKRKTFKDIMDVAKPVFDPEVHNSFQEYIDEYYAMDCEDFIDDIPCRFKYRQVVPNDFGLTVEEILAADDKELNQWVSSKKINKLRPEHVERNEVKIYRKKGQDFTLKKKVLASVYGSPQREEAPEEPQVDEASAPADPVAPSKKRKQPAETTTNQTQQPSKKKAKQNAWKERQNRRNADKKTTEPDVSDLRLKAYNIKPKEFKKKLKYKK